jgi:hypothetical protein
MVSTLSFSSSLGISIVNCCFVNCLIVTTIILQLESGNGMNSVVVLNIHFGRYFYF